ncbi:alpha/beta hydrolase [soil metagenome]
MQVIVNDLLTNYSLQGDGKLVLLLHGWGDNSQGSLALQKQLAQKYQVLTPDLPGFGKTQLPPSAWDLDDYANYLVALLDKLQLNQPYAIIGHSNGGAIAIRGTALGLLQPQKLVLMASAGIRSGKTIKKVLLQIIAKSGDLATIGLPDRYRNALRRQLYKSAGSDYLAVEQMEETFKKTVKQDVQADAEKITRPTLLIFGQNDKAVPPYMGVRYKTLIKDSSLHMLPDVGHFVHLDQPTVVSKLIEDFLA